MPKFCEDFSETQRRAAIGYAIAHRSVPAAMRAAAAGQLPECPEPFTISKSYLSELVRDEKERRAEGAPNRHATAAEIADDIMRRELKRIDTASRANRLNPQKAREMLRALRELAPIATKAAASNGNAEQAGDDAQDTEPPKGILERLAEIEARAAATEPEQTSDTGTGDTARGETDGAHGETPQTDTTTERQTSAVAKRVENVSAAPAGV